jgi:uronate dehydrogenase
MTRRLLLTGAAGVVAQLLRPMLRADWSVTLTDLRAPEAPPEPGETFLAGDLRDPGFTARITEDVTAIVHLGGVASPAATWPSLLETNVAGTAELLESARANGVRRLVLASSVHAAGGYNVSTEWPVQPTWPVRPCCPYGVSKTAIESMARLYSDEVEQPGVICLRFALVGHPVRTRLDARAALADEDLGTLITAALTTDRRFGIYFGASDCPDPRYDVTPGAEIGWQPRVRISDDGLPDARSPHTQRCRMWPAAD